VIEWLAHVFRDPYVNWTAWVLTAAAGAVLGFCVRAHWYPSAREALRRFHREQDAERARVSAYVLDLHKKLHDARDALERERERGRKKTPPPIPSRA
jgi:hypothetical protein